MSGANPACFKDTFWNIERVRRNLKLKDIAKRYNNSIYTIGGWFSGSRMPQYDIMVDLVKWFNELDPDHVINTTYGIQEFEMAHERWVALNKKEVKMKGINNDKNYGGKSPASRITKLIRERGYTQNDLAKKLDMKRNTLNSYLAGYVKATTDLIIELSDILDNTPENIEEMLTEVYNKKHTNPKQITTDDIQMGGFTDDIPVTHEVTDKDITEMLPSKELTVEHTMDGPKVVMKSTDKKEPETDIDQDAKNRLRFVKWFDMFISTPLYKRIDIIAHLMHLYVEWDYDMWDAVEALAEEDRSIPFYILRTIILECRRVDYFGERDVKQNG